MRIAKQDIIIVIVNGPNRERRVRVIFFLKWWHTYPHWNHKIWILISFTGAGIKEESSLFQILDSIVIDSSVFSTVDVDIHSCLKVKSWYNPKKMKEGEANQINVSTRGFLLPYSSKMSSLHILTTNIYQIMNCSICRH